MENKQSFYLLLSANIISGMAQGVSMLAIPWYFTHILSKGSTFATAYASITFLTIFWSLYAGTLIDRYSRKKIFLTLNIVCGLVLLLISLIGFELEYIPASLVILVLGVTIFNYNIHYPSLYAFAQEVSSKENYGKINSQIEIQGQATSIISGALAAILLSGTSNKTINLLGFNINLPFNIQRWELHEIFLVDAVTYFIAIVLILLIRYKPNVQQIQHGKILNRMKTGFNFLRSNPNLLIFGSASYTIFVILLIEVHLLLPLYVNNHLKEGADIYASSEIYYAIGALLAGFFIRNVFRTNTVRAIILLMFITTSVLLICAFTRNFIIFFIFSLIIGITNAGTRILRITYLLNHIPNNLIGRTNSVFQVINILLRSLFLAIFSIPFFSYGSNITWAYFIGGIFILLSTVVLIKKYKKLLELRVNTVKK